MTTNLKWRYRFRLGSAIRRADSMIDDLHSRRQTYPL